MAEAAAAASRHSAAFTGHQNGLIRAPQRGFRVNGLGLRV